MGRSRNYRGAALIVALFFTMILFISAVAFLTYLERDSALQLSAQRSARALYLAKAGIEHFCYRQYEGDFGQDRRPPPQGSGLAKLTNGQAVDLDFGRDKVKVTCVGNGLSGCRSQAKVYDDTGRLLASRTLVLPEGVGPSIPIPKGIIDAGQ